MLADGLARLIEGPSRDAHGFPNSLVAAYGATDVTTP